VTADEEPQIFQPGDAFRHFHYVIERFLGAGCSGQVYRVRHRFTGDRFALKVTHLADRARADRVARALEGAVATYRIQHGNVAQVFDLGCEPDGMVWQIMELLEGQTLAALIGRCGRFSPLYAVDVAIEIAWGLQAAHELGVIHRDVQPSNVFVTAAGRVKVIDFSLAKVIAASLKTTDGRRPAGSVGYMSPEHLKNAEPTAQFDVYALGIMLWVMLVGRHPFEESLGTVVAALQRHLNDDPGSLVEAAGLPAYFDEVVQRATAKDPDARYRGMWAFGKALLSLRERIVADRSLDARVRFAADWERRVPLVRGDRGAARYAPPAPPVETGPAPEIPSARVYVTQPKPAPTVPMDAVPALDPTPPPGTAPMEARRERPRSAPKMGARRLHTTPWAWAAVIVPVLAGVGAGVVSLGRAAPAPPTPPPPSTAAPRAPLPVSASPPLSPSPPADARRSPPSRPRR
jgi:serine/threonine-protein kinase